MQHPARQKPGTFPLRVTAGITLALTLAACGGGGAESESPNTSLGEARGGAPQTVVHLPVTYPDAADVRPTFHMAPAVLEEPSRIDEGGTNRSARLPPALVPISALMANVNTAQLTPQALTARLEKAQAEGAAGLVTPQSTIVQTVFSPAQIRAAYGLPDLPVVGAPLGADQAATLGRGQTIYIVDAYHNPNALSDLNEFSTRFGLQQCTNKAITTGTALPLAAPATDCEFSVAYSDTAGNVAASAPSYDQAWAGEIALDVQWAHAIAPLARIVLIEAPNSATNNMAGAVTLAGKMGPGVVSMSFGAPEGSWVPSYDPLFTATGMSYVASSGDSGYQAAWPAVSSKVVAVGGTRLGFDGTSARYEEAWSKSGGGISAFEPLPAYQIGKTLGGVALTKRGGSDVSWNADPATGHYTALTVPGGSLGWFAMGGTSASAPQWAGVLAVVNAVRATKGLPAIGDPHDNIYGIAAVPGNYAAALSDIKVGNNGACTACRSIAGLDAPTGWGTPNVSYLIQLLTSTDAVPTPPSAMAPGETAKAYATQWAATDSKGSKLTYVLTGAPTGLVVGTTGLVSWPKPLAGKYTFGVTVKNVAGATATATVSLTIVQSNRAPIISALSLSGTAGIPISGQLSAMDPDGDGFTFSAAGPTGLTVSPTGAISWPNPVRGTYYLKISARDARGAIGTATVPVTVAYAPTAPVVASVTVSGKVGTALARTVTATDVNGGVLTYSVSGLPAGMTFDAALHKLSWPAPQVGTYPVTVTATDAGGLKGSGVLTFVIVQPNRAPVLPGGQFTGVASQPFSAQVTGGTDADGDTFTFLMSGAPAGLTINSTTGVLYWLSPVKGTYTLRIYGRDSHGLIGPAATYTLTIS